LGCACSAREATPDCWAYKQLPEATRVDKMKVRRLILPAPFPLHSNFIPKRPRKHLSAWDPEIYGEPGERRARIDGRGCRTDRWGLGKGTASESSSPVIDVEARSSFSPFTVNCTVAPREFAGCPRSLCCSNSSGDR
jgi:hypothetical protein